MTVDPNTAPLSEAKLDALDVLARKATPGPYEAPGPFVLSPGRRCVARMDWEIRDEVDDDNVSYFVALDPATVLSLLSMARSRAQDDTSREGEELAHRIQDTIDAWAKKELADCPESEGGITSWSDRIATAVVAAHSHSLEAAPVAGGDAVAGTNWPDIPAEAAEWSMPDEERRGYRLVAQTGTDGATPSHVIKALIGCAVSWQPDVRIIGNIRACDIVRALSLSRPLEAAPVDGGEAMAIEQMVAGTSPMSKWLASVDYSTYAGFEKYLKTQLREVLNLKSSLDKTRKDSPEDEALATFVDGRSHSLEAALATFRVVMAREKVPALTDKSGNAELIERLESVGRQLLECQFVTPLLRLSAADVIKDAYTAVSRSPAPDRMETADKAEGRADGLREAAEIARGKAAEFENSIHPTLGVKRDPINRYAEKHAAEKVMDAILAALPDLNKEEGNGSGK